MRKQLNISLFLALLLILSSVDAQAQSDNSFTPYGKPLALIYTNVNYSFNKAGNTKAFELARAYLGYEYFFSKNISSRVNIDIADPGVGKLQMIAYIKNAFVQYKNDDFSVRFGMIGLNQFNIQEKQWGYRYIYRSFQEANNFGPSTDLGVLIEYMPSKIISLDFSIVNGEGYKKIQADTALKATFGITLRPFNGFVLRGYYDIMKKDYAQVSTSLYAGYTIKNFKAGLEYNIQKNNGIIDGNNFSGISVYTSLGLAKKFSIFTRYDYLTSVTPAGETDPWNSSKDGQLFLAGFDYSPITGVRIAPAFVGWSPFDKTKYFTSKFALDFEIKF